MRSSNWLTLEILDFASASFCTYGTSAGILLISANFRSSRRVKWHKGKNWGKKDDFKEEEISNVIHGPELAPYRLEESLSD